jgi:hypothetical protein
MFRNMNDADFIHATAAKGDHNAIAGPFIEAAQRIRLVDDAIRATLHDVEGPAEPGPHTRAIGRATDLPLTGDKATDYRMLADHMLKAQCAMLKDALGEEKAHPLIDGLIAADKDERMMFDVLGSQELVERVKKGEMSPREISDALMSRMLTEPPQPGKSDSGTRYKIVLVGAIFGAVAIAAALLYFAL